MLAVSTAGVTFFASAKSVIHTLQRTNGAIFLTWEKKPLPGSNQLECAHNTYYEARACQAGEVLTSSAQEPSAHTGPAPVRPPGHQLGWACLREFGLDPAESKRSKLAKSLFKTLRVFAELGLVKLDDPPAAVHHSCGL